MQPFFVINKIFANAADTCLYSCHNEKHFKLNCIFFILNYNVFKLKYIFFKLIYNSFKWNSIYFKWNYIFFKLSSNFFKMKENGVALSLAGVNWVNAVIKKNCLCYEAIHTTLLIIERIITEHEIFRKDVFGNRTVALVNAIPFLEYASAEQNLGQLCLKE